MNVSSHKLSSEFHWQNLVQASCHLLNSSWPPASLLLNSCPWPLSAPTSSTERQTPASSPARPATPHTDISTDLGLMTGRPVKLAIVWRMKLFLRKYFYICVLVVPLNL